MSQLPPELIGYIIDYFHDSPQDLRACARVCKSWLDFSRSHLFYRILVHVDFYPSLAYTRLCEVIQQSPSIALYVRELCFSYFSCWGVLIKGIPQLLQSFTNLRKLVLVTMEWTLLMPEIKKSICDVLALPSLVHFEAHSRFTRLEDFSSLLHPHLIRLGLFIDKISIKEAFTELGHEGAELNSLVQAYHEAQGECEGGLALERQPCRLVSLEWDSLCPYPEVIDLLLGEQSVVDFSNLRSLVVRVDEGDMESLVRLLRTLGSSLEHLTIDAPRSEFWDSFCDGVDLGPKPNLRTLSLKTVFCSNAAKCLTQFLPNLATPSLHRISFQFSFPWNYVDMDMVWNDWMEVGWVIDGQPLDLLRSVKVALKTPRNWILDRKQFYHKFAENFPSLASRRIQFVDFE